MIHVAKPLLGEEEKRAVLEVLTSGMLAQGRKVEEFEKRFAEFIGVKHAIATSNGTTALHAALLANGIRKGDEVITSPFTFIATANAILMTGAKPVFVDIEEKSFNLDLKLVEGAITPRTKAILLVHLFGRPVEMDKLGEIAWKHNLLIIEDACQAHGAEFNGKKVGSFGTGCFSFYPTKNMTTGEGGVVTTNSDDVAEKMKKIISHGSEKRYYHEFLGYNYRMTDIAAAIGLGQLKKLNSFNEMRKRNAAYFSRKLDCIVGLELPEIIFGHVFHQYTLRVTPEFGKTREEVIGFLKGAGIGSSVFYPVPIHKQEAYLTYKVLSFPVAEKLAKEVLSIPIHPGLKEEDLNYIIGELKRLDGDQK
jgi:perosamine synthetase